MTTNGQFTLENEFTVEYDREKDGRWIAEVRDVPGALAYGRTRDEAAKNVMACALRVIADRLQRERSIPPKAHVSVSFTA
jgi:predicted RNase H-like HicB family nuclease